MEEIMLKAKDGFELCLHVFAVENPKGVIQVMHGMEEHQERYERLVGDFNKAGFSVVTADMRGHGHTAKTLGYFADKKGDEILIQDQLDISDYIRKSFGVTKIIIFAHSMGTITARDVLMEHSGDYEKVVLSGYPNPQPAAGVGAFLAGIIQAFHGAKYFSKFTENLAVGSFAKAVKDRKTDFDWLSYNEENVKKYMEDPFCGHGFTVSGCHALFTLMAKMGKAKNYKNVNPDLPILLVSGEDDPCTGGEKGRASSKKTLEKAGFHAIDVITYTHMRHEILNEEEHQKVHDDVIEFLA